MRSAAPIVIAESAMLNAGQCQPAACKSRKSTTWPKRRRSTRFPSAPPRISASPPDSIRRSGERTSSTETTIAAPRAKAASTGVCQPASAARKLNAAPLLNTSTRLKKPVSSARSPGAKRASTSHFVIWSASTIGAAPRSQGAALDISARLARPAQIRPAARAQARVVDVRGVMPAAVAFAIPARLHLDRSLAPVDASRGGDEQELQLVFETGEQLVVLFRGMQVNFGLQRRADLVLRAQLLDLLAHRVAQLAQALPLRKQAFAIGHGRKRVQRMEEHAVVLLSGEVRPEFLGGERKDRRHQTHEAVRDVEKR